MSHQILSMDVETLGPPNSVDTWILTKEAAGIRLMWNNRIIAYAVKGNQQSLDWLIATLTKVVEMELGRAIEELRKE